MKKRKSSRTRQRNLPQTGGIKLPDFYFWGSVPVRFLPTKDGGMTSERLDLTTGRFVRDGAMVSEIFFRPFTSTDVERVGSKAFYKRVEEIRKNTRDLDMTT